MAASVVKLALFTTATDAKDTAKLVTEIGLRFANFDTALVPSIPRSRCRAMALPRYPNHNIPYDPWEDPALDMPPHKMLKKGDPGTFQAIIKGAMPVGYWVTMPSGNEAYLPAQDIGFPGGLDRLSKIFKPGDEVTVRVVTRGSSGREVLSLKVPDPNKPDPPPKPLRKDFLPGGSLAARRRRLQQQQ
ncbi:hypothetical protein L7F22_061724 [Adiantum nelumboides]|nr:hypothetical protein [Adiantum nelumboides]